MQPPLLGLIVDQLGFITGAVLYAMLLVMVWRERAASPALTPPRRSRLPILTGVFGLLWNTGALVALDVGGRATETRPILIAVAFAALGFLPAAVVHSVFEGRQPVPHGARTGTAVIAAYGLSILAGVLHVSAALGGAAVPSPAALWLLTIGFTLLAWPLFIVTRQQPVGRRGVWIVALSIFAVSALHFNRHVGDEAWWVELIGHHASLPLAVAILYQDYRFAFADLFLKHAIALLMLVASGLLVFSSLTVPALGWRDTSAAPAPRVLTIVILLWIGTAVMYGRFRHWAGRFVDRAFLQRPDYSQLLASFSKRLDQVTTEDAAFDATEDVLRLALTPADITRIDDPFPGDHAALPVTGPETRRARRDGTAAAVLRIRTIEAPHAALVVGPLMAGRRLLSDDVHWMSAVATLAAQRIDALRVSQERHARDLREEAMERLAAEAELRALRAQLQPHFLFNALTTVGYLIQQSPQRALDTLLRLTTVLRGVLSRTSREFSTLGEEVDLVSSYLDIERARFEERLDVVLDVSASARSCMVPTLLLQPLVENAVRHGIAPKAAGGTVSIRAVVNAGRLHVSVEDSGIGFSQGVRPSGAGVGLRSVEERLRAHYGADAVLHVDSAEGTGTVVAIELPASHDRVVGGAEAVARS